MLDKITTNNGDRRGDFITEIAWNFKISFTQHGQRWLFKISQIFY